MWGAASLAWSTVVDFLLFLGTLAFLRDTKTPLTATRFIGTRAMRMVRRTVSLDDIKAIKNAMDCVTIFLVLKLLQWTTLAFSNNIGPVEGIEFCGNPIVYIATGVFGGPHAITLHFQSYMNKMEIVVAVDESVVPDPHELLGDLADSLKLIKDAAVFDF